MVFFRQNNQGNQDDQGNQGQDNGSQGGNGNNNSQNGHDNGNEENNNNGSNNGNDNEDNDQNDHDHNNSLNNHKKVVCRTEICENITTVVPIDVYTHADIGNITLKCKRNHIKETERLKHTHKFEVVQEVFAHIPIDFVAEVTVKDEKTGFDVHECKK